jgi:anthranilate phosphoribosyltransferase
VLRTSTQSLAAGRAIAAGEFPSIIAALTAETIPAGDKADFLIALATKGETPEEIAGFARELGALSIRPELPATLRNADILDVCGTGGDHLNTFNISTTVAILCAAAGVVVAKHGNRAITSQSGSADVLEALGIRIDLSPEEAVARLADDGFAFFFAPKFHPAFKHIAPARKLCAERGQRTVFNFLGPLLNPVRPSVQLMGVPRAELCEPVAKVMQQLGVRRAMVVSGSVTDGGQTRSLDELSILGPNRIAEFYHDRALHLSDETFAMLPLRPASLADLRGGDKTVNAGIIRQILGGEERGPKRDAVLLNAAAALFVAGKCRSMTEGWEMAAETIDSGKAAAKLKRLGGC